MDAWLARPTWRHGRPTERRSARLLQSLPDELARLLDVPALQVAAATPPVLPPYTLAAALTSERGARTDHPDFRSRLGIVWFVDSLDAPPLALLAAAVRGLAWEEVAVDEPAGDL
jgi:hypothetical protein